MNLLPYFAYGTTQQGFAHHRRFADRLGEPVARVRTAAAHAVVVPRQAGCSNPGCPFLHRMAALVPGFDPLRVEGDLFLITAGALAVVDRLETGAAGVEGPYVRATVAVVALAGGERHDAHAYLAREGERWRALAELGAAETLAAYPRDLAAAERRKECCVRRPGHAPPHDVVDPLDALGGQEAGPRT